MEWWIYLYTICDKLHTLLYASVLIGSILLVCGMIYVTILYCIDEFEEPSKIYRKFSKRFLIVFSCLVFLYMCVPSAKQLALITFVSSETGQELIDTTTKTGKNFSKYLKALSVEYLEDITKDKD